LGNFEILGLIGSGGMGDVYRAHDPNLGRDVAVKVLPAAFAQDAQRLRRFQREARILASLSHPNLVQIFDAGEQDGHPYLVMELLTGETLRSRLSRGRLPWRKAAEVAAAAADGLSAAHAQGIVHRDLKPDNLFLTELGHVKVLDFGIARPQQGDPEETATRIAADLKTQEGLLVGTAAYMSPEQVRGESLDGRSDLFSLGMILWEMLTGHRPFKRPTTVELLSAILKEDVPAMDPGLMVPPSLERILEACLAKDPRERFHSAHDLAFALRDLAQGSATGSGRLLLPPRWRRFTSSRWRWGVPGAALMALAFLGGLWVKAPQGPPQFRQLTFQKGEIGCARFSADGMDVVYDFLQGGAEPRLLTLRLDTLEEEAAGETPGRLLALSSRGEWAVQAQPKRDLDALELFRGTLALAVGRGTAPRDMIRDVVSADFSPSGDLAVVRCLQGHFRLECPAGKVRLERGTFLNTPRYSQDGHFLAFLECPQQDLGMDGLSIQVLDLDTGSLRTLPQRGRFQGLAWRGGDLVTVRRTGRGSCEVLAFAKDGQVRKLAEAPGNWALQDADRRGRLLLSETNIENTIRVWSPTLQPQDLSVRGGGNLFGLTPDGRRVLIQASAPSRQGNQDPTLYSREVAGGLPTFLGHGSAGALSQDGAWLAVVEPGSRVAIGLMPTGSKGMARRLEIPELDGLLELRWTLDGHRILAAGHAKDRPSRIWLLDLLGGAPKPVTPEGVTCSEDWLRLSPDGHFLVAEEDRRLVLADLTAPSRPPRPIPGLGIGEFTAGWSQDSRKVFVWKQGPLPLEIASLDVASGERRPLFSLTAEDQGQILTNPFVSPDGRVLAANLVKLPSNLFLLEGLK
jgi:tRNA A-37 threonylcarbamoyl transferase component Bud32